ncbi:MAG: hypothetical protein K0S51_1717 [Bacillales bacterium]|jgi:hypothetical protein|nr:hypothetical protein [Bacillales bacterium]
MEKEQLIIVLNGIVKTLDTCEEHLERKVRNKLKNEKNNIVFDIEKIKRTMSKHTVKVGLNN